MMKSKKKKMKAKKTRIAHLRAKRKGKKTRRVFKRMEVVSEDQFAQTSKLPEIPHKPSELIHDDQPLTATERARVKESRQNIKDGKYRDFVSVDDVWKFAESD